jgi:hypothetical protein
MTDKIQRSFYLTPEEATQLKVRAAQEGMSQSALVGLLIEKASMVLDSDPGEVVPRKGPRFNTRPFTPVPKK